MPKKQKIQGFWLFLIEWKDQQAAKGCPYTNEEAFAMCDPIWKVTSNKLSIYRLENYIMAIFHRI
jgi:hypothetical protein